MELNKHTEAYLDYYVSLKTPPNFAVFIRGKWGSGKSWFIKKYIGERKDRFTDVRFLKVSLYGVTSYADIESLFYKELNPFLASEGVKIAGALLKGILKTTIKFDIDAIGDEKTDTTLTGTVPTVGMPLLKSFKELKSCVLIFDDLERCSLPLLDILGYINQFVENEDLKAILIGNEEEIIRKDKPNENDSIRSQYLSIKEKLIGKTFEVQTDVDQAIRQFISQLPDSKLQVLLAKFTGELKRVFEIAGYNNLRHLRQSILDFERFYTFLPADSLVKDDLIRTVLQTFFSISIELKKGALKEEDVEELFQGPLVRRRDNEDPVKKIHSKYTAFSQFTNVIDPKSWADYFSKGLVDEERLRQSIYGSVYYHDQNTPDWKKLSNFYYLTQSEFDTYFFSVNNRFVNLTILTVEELVETVALLLYFSDSKLINLSHDEIIDLARKNIDNLQKTGTLLKAVSKTDYFPQRNRSLDYQLYDSEQFKAFFKLLHTQIINNRSEVLKQAANELLVALNHSAQAFDEKLLIDEQGVSRYMDTPILPLINVSDFVDAFWRLTPAERYALGHTLKNRYTDEDFNEKLAEELPWLKNVMNQIDQENQAKNEPLTQYLVKTKFIELLRAAIDLLENSTRIKK